MTEPLETSNYGIPLQVAGQGARARMNAAIVQLDSIAAGLEGLIGGLFLAMPTVRRYPVIVAAGGETVIELPEPYTLGLDSLFVVRGGFPHALGHHFFEEDDRHIRFLDPCEPGELIQVLAFQAGTGGLPPRLSSGVSMRTIEPPFGVIDSTDGINGNGTFTLSHPIAEDTVPRLIVSGSWELEPTSQFTWDGYTIEILPGSKPIVGENLRVEYEWRF